MSGVTNAAVRISVGRLIKFLDEVSPETKGHAPAVATFIGEDLGASLVKHCLESVHRAKVNILAESPMTGGPGPWLDRWIHVRWLDSRQTLFQTEVKSWSASAKDGRPLAANATPDKVAQYKIERWQKEGRYGNIGWIPRPLVAKVLSPMKRPQSVDQKCPVEPLLVYWWCVHPDGGKDSLFEVPVDHSQFPFRRLWVFSMSSYLRGLRTETLDLNMPIGATRIRWLNSVISPVT